MAIADTGNNRVIVADLDGRVDQVYPQLTRPQGLAFDGARLIVCDTGADRVVAIDRASGEQVVLAEGLASPWDVALLTGGAMLVAEAGRHRIWKIPPEGVPFVAVGTGEENLEDDPPLLAQPSGLATLADGGAVFVDAESSALRVLLAGGGVSTLVGQGLFDWGASDGGPDSSAMQHPLGVTVAPNGTVYVADTFNHMIRAWEGSAWTAAAGSLRTLAVAGLNEPGGVAALPDGRLLVADTNNHRVVIVTEGGSAPQPIVLDESWLGTATASTIAVDPGQPISLPYDLDPGEFSLDDSSGPAVRIEVSAEPPSLLGPGPRSWALDLSAGELAVVAGAPGEGVLVVSAEMSVCNEDQCTVLRTRHRHDLVVAQR
jgi:sugar lactone lactonase YvrE